MQTILTIAILCFCCAVSSASMEIVDFGQKSLSGGSRISTPRNGLAITDWKKYKTLNIFVSNEGREAHSLTVRIYDQENRSAACPFELNAGFSGSLKINLEELDGVIDLAKVRSIAILAAEPRNAEILLSSATLDETPFSIRRRTDPDKVVSRTCDIRRLKYTYRKETTKVQYNPDGSLDVTCLKPEHGNSITFLLKEMGYDIATHYSFEIEYLSGTIPSNNVGSLLLDSRKKSLWKGIGNPLPEKPVKVNAQLYDHNLAELEQLVISRYTRNFSRYQYRIRKLQFEFHPEFVLGQTKKALDILRRQKLNAEERAAADQLQEKLLESYARVKGETFRHGDAVIFLKIAHEVKTDALAELRKYNRRVAFEATGTIYGVACADSMNAVFLTGPGTEMTTGEYTLELACNEYESFQTVVIAGKQPLKNMKVEISDFTGPGGNRIQARYGVVGHSKTQPQDYPCEYTGYYPEMILFHQQKAHVAPYESVPFWIRLYAPKSIPPGLYTARVSVSGDQVPVYCFPLKVKVFNFSIPDGSVLPTCLAFDQRSRFFSKEPTARKSYIEKLVDTAAEYRMIYDQLYWRGGLDRKEQQLYGVTQEIAELDRTIYYEQLRKLNDAGLLKQFCLAYLYCPAKDYWTLDYSVNDPNDPRLDKVIRKQLRFLREQAAILKKMGLYSKAYLYGFDEEFPTRIQTKIIKEVKREFPELPIYTTMRLSSAQEDAAKQVDTWITSLFAFLNEDLIKDFRKAGKKVYFYVCNYPRPPYPSFLLEMPAIVPRLMMGVMPEKFHVDGFLYFQTTCWFRNQEAVSWGPRVAWRPDTNNPNRDTSDAVLFYPGMNQTILPAIRTENYRDGVEDHWYYTILKRMLCSNRITQKQRKLMTELLDIPESIVKTPEKYTHDARLLRNYRRKLASAIEMLQSTTRKAISSDSVPKREKDQFLKHAGNDAE